jgi:hypothetical protein
MSAAIAATESAERGAARLPGVVIRKDEPLHHARVSDCEGLGDHTTVGLPIDVRPTETERPQEVRCVLGVLEGIVVPIRALGVAAIPLVEGDDGKAIFEPRGEVTVRMPATLEAMQHQQGGPLP